MKLYARADADRIDCLDGIDYGSGAGFQARFSEDAGKMHDIVGEPSVPLSRWRHDDAVTEVLFA